MFRDIEVVAEWIRENKMQNPNILKIGSGYIDKVESILRESNISGKLLYITDSVIDSLYGENVRKQIERVGRLKTEIIDSNTISYAMSVAERVIATDIDCIVGMGGGKVLDVCKYAAYISKTPYLSIPTTAANDGLASPIAVLKRKDNKPKSLGCAVAPMIMIDTDIIASGPLQLIKAGIGDTISNYMALQDWDFAAQHGLDTINGYAYLISRASLDLLMKTQYDHICLEFVEVLIKSLVLSGIAMDFAGSSRPVSGSEHLFSHALDYYADAKNLHGIQVALGTIAILKLLGKPYEEVLGYLKRFEVDINPKHLGISQEIFILCMQKATSMRRGRYTHLHAVNMEDEILKNLYNELTEEL